MASTTDQATQPRRPSIVRRAALPNLAVLALIFVLLLVTPVTLHAPPRPIEAAILAAGLIVMAALNVLLIRRAFTPLRSFAAQMEAVDLRDPAPSRLVGPIPSEELAVFVNSFNGMLERLAEERRAGARAALVAQERERLRIARALHDEAGQTLTAVALEIERAAEQAPEAERQRMVELVAELHSTLDEIRRIARELRPEALDDLGLINALIALSSRAARQGGLRIERRLASDLPPMSEELELVVYRVAQEALTNVLRHAEASHCLIELTGSPEAIALTVSDDGKGMPASYDRTIGIEGMRERALLVDGTLAIESKPGAGTTVRLRVPREEV